MKNNSKIFFTLLIAMLIGIFCITIYVYTVFFANKQKYIMFYKNFEATVEDISSLFDKNLSSYETRLQKTAKELNINDYIQKTILEGSDEEWKNKIINIFLNVNPKFENITLYLSDGKVIFSTEKDKLSLTDQNILKDVQNKKSKAYCKYQSDKENIKMIVPLLSDSSLITAYLETYIPKDVFSLSGMVQYSVLPSGILYRSENTGELDKKDYEKISSLYDGKSGYKKIENLPYRLYIAKTENNANLTIGALVHEASKTKNILEYIILIVFLLSFIFLIILIVLVVKSKGIENKNIEKEKTSERIKSTHSDLTEKNYSVRNENLLDSGVNENTEDYDLEEKIVLDNLDNLENIDDISDESLYGNSKNISETEEETSIIDIPNIEEDISLIDSLFEENDKNESIYLTGSNLDEMIEKENDYFSSDEAFKVSNEDFLGVIKEGEEEENTEDEKITLDTDIVESMIENMNGAISNDIEEDEIDEVPVIPDDYYKNNDEAIWNSFLLDITGYDFIGKTLNEIIDEVKEELNVSISKCIYLKYNENSMSYMPESALDIDDETKSICKIDIDEPLFVKLLSKGKALYIDDPFTSEIIASKFSKEQYTKIKRMLFVPVKNAFEIEAFILIIDINEFKI